MVLNRSCFSLWFSFTVFWTKLKQNIITDIESKLDFPKINDTMFDSHLFTGSQVISDQYIGASGIQVS